MRPRMRMVPSMLGDSAGVDDVDDGEGGAGEGEGQEVPGRMKWTGLIEQ